MNFLLLMTQGRIWHALQPNWSMLTILVHCSFTPLLWPPCTRLIYVSTQGVFIRPQWSVVYPQRFYNFTMQVNLACPLGNTCTHKPYPHNKMGLLNIFTFLLTYNCIFWGFPTLISMIMLLFLFFLLKKNK